MYTVVIKQTLQAYFGVGIANFGWSIAQQLTTGPGGATAGAGGAWFPTPQFAPLGLGNLGNGGAGAVSAGAGQAARVGMLSVPPAVGHADLGGEPGHRREVEPAPQSRLSRRPVHQATPCCAECPPAAVGRRAGAAAGYFNKYGFRYSVLTRPPSAG